MILSHLAEDVLALCPASPSGFLFAAFPVSGATWLDGIHWTGSTYAGDLAYLPTGGSWTADTGPIPASTSKYTAMTSATAGWASQQNFTTSTWEFWQRDSGGWTLRDTVSNAAHQIGSAAIHSTDPTHVWAVLPVGVFGPNVRVGASSGGAFTWTTYNPAPGLTAGGGFVRGQAGSLFVVAQLNSTSGSGHQNTWMHQLEGSRANTEYLDGDLLAVDSVVSDLWAPPTGDLWGAGWLWQNTESARHATLWRHDGSGWTVQRPPLPAGEAESRFYSIHGAAADDLWAVGYWKNTDGLERVFLCHYDGSTWSQVLPAADYSATPVGTAIMPYLVWVRARTSTDVWAVGAACDQWLILHWDGSTWQDVTPATVPT